MPFKFVRKLTIVPCNHEEIFEKEWCYFGGPPFLAIVWYMFELSLSSYFYFAVPIGILMGLFFWKTLRKIDFDDKINLPKPSYYPFVAI